MLAGFLVIETRAKAPLLPLRLFRLKTLAGSNAVSFLLGASFFAFIFIGTPGFGVGAQGDACGARAIAGSNWAPATSKAVTSSAGESTGRMMTAMAGSFGSEVPNPSADASASRAPRRAPVSAARSASHRSITAPVGTARNRSMSARPMPALRRSAIRPAVAIWSSV